jgi:hypothetical protein
MRVHAFAIFLGTITDLFLSFTLPVLLYFLGVNARNPHWYEWSLVLGLVTVAIGGYVTARKSDSSQSFNAILFGAIQMLLGVAAAAFMTLPLWFNVASFVLVTPAALFGAYLAIE